MDLYEYQAKQILRDYGIAMPRGGVAKTAREAQSVSRGLECERLAVKAQVHAGARGRAGGVRMVSPADVESTAAELLGKRLVTEQTGPEGRQVSCVYVECAPDVAKEIYLAVLVERATGRLAMIGSQNAGMAIEEHLEGEESDLAKVRIEDPAKPEATDFLPFVQALGLDARHSGQAVDVCRTLARAALDLDARLIEINPLAVTGDGRLMTLDVKMTIDDNALFRQPKLAAMRDDEFDPVELEAQRHDVNLVQMDGNIGVIVNGAGLALATLDMLCDAGGKAANFMDIRTTARSLQIAEGIGLVLSNSRVDRLLVNIYGGGFTRCDTIADGLAIAFRRSGRGLPVVFRAAGTHADMAHTVLKNCGIDYYNADSMREAVREVVKPMLKEAS